MSLALSLEIADIREDLAKVAVVSIVEGFVNEKSVLEIILKIVNIPIAGLITLINDCNFLVLLVSREEVKQVYKLDVLKVLTKDNDCMLKLAPWKVELGTDSKASEAGQ